MNSNKLSHSTIWAYSIVFCLSPIWMLRLLVPIWVRYWFLFEHPIVSQWNDLTIVFCLNTMTKCFLINALIIGSYFTTFSFLFNLPYCFLFEHPKRTLWTPNCFPICTTVLLFPIETVVFYLNNCCFLFKLTISFHTWTPLFLICTYPDCIWTPLLLFPIWTHWLLFLICIYPNFFPI